jgi:signal transduction histidine kinase
LLDLVHPDDHGCAAAFFYALAAERGVRPEVEFRFRRGDGTWLLVEAIGNNLLHDRLVQGIVVTLRDVSKRKALEDGLKRQVQELQQLDQIKTDLVSTVSHELRTPLTAMIGHVELLSQGELGELNLDQVWAVGAIERNSHRLLSLIEDLLTLSKIETGGFGLTMAPTDLRMLVEEISTAMAPAASEHSLEMTFEVGSDVDLMLADRSGLERALTNLLSNAVKFTPAGGKVSLSVARQGQSAVFTVSDTGIGMSAEDKDRLFTRFFRSPAAMSMAIPGTGLGLAIVKKIVDDHRGEIHVDSSPGAGTTVTFTIPLVRMDRPVRAVAATSG